MGEALSDLFEQTDMVGGTLPEDLFSILETFEDTFSSTKERASIEGSNFSHKVATQLVSSSQVGSNSRPFEAGDEGQAPKKLKLDDSPRAPADSSSQDGQQKTSHITVERNRRKQMNEHLSVLRSLMPCFYTKRGDQASIIGGVVDYIKELQQVLQSLEAKKQRKTYSEVLSPRPAICSSPRPPPLSPRMALPISPRTPQPGSPYMPRIQPQQQPQQGYLSPAVLHVAESSPSFNSTAATTATTNTEIVAASNSESPVAKVEVKFSGPNVILKTISHRIPGQAFKIITALESLAMEILHVSISTNVNDDIMLNSFTIKIGIECELSAEELAQEIQQTFL